jgi:hypothetical protein
MGSRNHVVEVHAGWRERPKPWSGGNTRSEESSNGGVTDDALAARGRDDDNDFDRTHVGKHGPGPWPGEGTKGCTRDRDSRTARKAACAQRREENETIRNTNTRHRP